MKTALLPKDICPFQIGVNAGSIQAVTGRLTRYGNSTVRPPLKKTARYFAVR